MDHKRIGADALLDCLEAIDCRVLFGLPGTTVAPLLDRLLAHPNIQYVLTKHEGVAVAMAEGYARIRGTPAIVSLYMAVGLANGVSMLYNAHKSRVPLVVLVSQQDLALRLGTETVVDGDQLHLVRGIARHAVEVTLPERLCEHFIRAHKQAAGPLVPGPSLVSIPRDVLMAESLQPSPGVDGFKLSSRVEPLWEQLEQAAKLLVEAERPLIIAGSQVVRFDAIGELEAFAETLACPVTLEYFFNDRIGFPQQHPCALGQFGASAEWRAKADVVLALGCRLHHELMIPERPRLGSAKLIQVNVEPEQLALKEPCAVPMMSDARSALRGLRRAIEPRIDGQVRNRLAARRAEITQYSADARARRSAAARVGWDEFPLRPPRLVSEIDEVVGSEARIVIELSTSMSCFYEFYSFRRPELVHGSSGCALGWGMAAAAGMKLAEPRVPTLACVGDGAFLFGVQSLWTLANYRIPVVVIVFNNGGYYSTRLYTERLGGLTQKTGRYTGGDMPDDPTDCAAIAAGFGICAERITKPHDFRPALLRALAADAPYVIDVPVQRVDFRMIA